MDVAARNIVDRLKRPIVIVGLMGAGKTKIGGLVAAALGLSFIDADHEIERSAGCTIAEIFARDGEPAFRAMEAKVITRLLGGELRVIAPGGGALMNPQTAALIKEKAVSIWLKADLDILVERTARSSKRPLLNSGDPKTILADLMRQRDPVYRQADIVVDSDRAPADETARKVIAALQDFLEQGEPA